MCLRPLKAFLPPDGGRPLLSKEGDLQIPCGKCTECIQKRSSEWALRCEHEISEHDQNCFITLTYSEDNLPSLLLVKKDFQDFMKRLRDSISPKKIRYIMCGEYGELSNRPHFHAIIFGWSPDDQEYLFTTNSDSKMFTSQKLLELWNNKGHVSVGEANVKTAYYVASYALKKKKHDIHVGNGELLTVSDYMTTSKRPAVGLNYFKKYYKEMINRGDSLPRYYVKKLEEIDQDWLQIYEDKNQVQKNRSDSELYAKFIIDQQKLQKDSTFRTGLVDDPKATAHYKELLQSTKEKFFQRTQK